MRFRSRGVAAGAFETFAPGDELTEYDRFRKTTDCRPDSIGKGFAFALRSMGAEIRPDKGGLGFLSPTETGVKKNFVQDLSALRRGREPFS